MARRPMKAPRQPKGFAGRKSKLVGRLTPALRKAGGVRASIAAGNKGVGPRAGGRGAQSY